MRDIAKQTLKVIVSMAPALTDAVLVNSLNNNYALGGLSPKGTRVCVCLYMSFARISLQRLASAKNCNASVITRQYLRSLFRRF